MSIQTKAWLKGAFPQWLSAILLAIAGYLSVEILRDIKTQLGVLTTSAQLREVKISILETRLGSMERQLDETRTAINEMSRAVRAIRPNQIR